MMIIVAQTITDNNTTLEQHILSVDMHGASDDR